MIEEIHILAFYKYVNIENPERFMKDHLNFCLELGIRGRILVGKEGINGSVSGTLEQTEKYKEYLLVDLRFQGMMFKEDVGLLHPFEKMQIKVKEEVVHFGVDVDLKYTGTHLQPSEFLEIYDEQGKLKDNILLLDARNDYEYNVGRFKDSVHLDIKNFRDFPEAAKQQLVNKKDKKVVMFCTGGIRCEKASAYLKQELGFQDVAQIDGGIANFGKQFPDTVWEGSLFVFDKRLVVPINQKDQRAITECVGCGKECDLYKNCRNAYCDKLYITCIDCEHAMNGCCSDNCLEEFRKQCLEKSADRQGRKTKEVGEE